jgi:hypothetical protein
VTTTTKAGLYVKVEDKAPPVIQCPPNMTIFCDWAITYSTDLGSGAQPTEGVDFTKTGLPVGYGTCGPLTYQIQRQYRSVEPM